MRLRVRGRGTSYRPLPARPRGPRGARIERRAMRLYAFHCGGERAKLAAFDPFDPDAGATIDIPYFFFLIQHPRGTVVFDSGAHPSLATNPRERLGDEADNWEIV